MKAPFKKYIVFVMEQYYPSGGLNDIEDSFDNLEEAEEFVRHRHPRTAFDIVDRDTWEVVR